MARQFWNMHGSISGPPISIGSDFQEKQEKNIHLSVCTYFAVGWSQRVEHNVRTFKQQHELLQSLRRDYSLGLQYESKLCFIIRGEGRFPYQF